MVTRVEFSDDGAQAISGSKDDTVCEFNIPRTPGVFVLVGCGGDSTASRAVVIVGSVVYSTASRVVVLGVWNTVPVRDRS